MSGCNPLVLRRLLHVFDHEHVDRRLLRFYFQAETRQHHLEGGETILITDTVGFVNLAPVNGDPIRLGQVVTNLLTNAIAYTPANGEIRIATRTEGDQSILSVEDTGVGISAEDLPHIFERFYRADKSRTRANGHTGLGLAICKAIIDAHDGSLEATSEPGIGSAFVVRLPIARTP